MAATFLDLQSILVTPPTMLQSTRWRNCRCLNKPGGVLCVECHCVMLTIYPFTVSFWLHSSGQAKANCVFFSILQNGIIWQLFLLQGAVCRGQLFMSPSQVHIMHRLFVLQILMALSNTFSLNRANSLEQQ